MLDLATVIAQLWQAQIPATVMGAGPMGVQLYALGQTFVLQTQDQLDWFLRGFKLGEQAASQPEVFPPWQAPQEEDQGAE